MECIRHSPTYFAKRLHNALDRMNVDDDTLIRCLVGRSEVSIIFTLVVGKTSELLME